ncbi:MAG: hypothetical protein ACTSY1_00040 [Alphaproteobacteria bacterium]
MKPKIHAIAGAIALLTVSAFWISTLGSEIFGSHDQVAFVKNAILLGMVVLIPALAIAGASGFALSRKRNNPLVARKKQRMKIAAGNGILVLLPASIFLVLRATQLNFDPWFVAIQAMELVAGAANITLLSLNMMDGVRLHRTRKNLQKAQC